jgi:hypothetical protein
MDAAAAPGHSTYLSLRFLANKILYESVIEEIASAIRREIRECAVGS